MEVLKQDLIAVLEVEVLPDEEFALWEQAVTDAEQHKAERSTTESLQPEHLQTQQLSAQEVTTVDHRPALEVVLPDLEDFGLKVNRRAKHRPRGLRVTDITGAEWCQQQLAYALSARLPKVNIFACSNNVWTTRCWSVLRPATVATGGNGDRSNGSWHSCTCSSGGRYKTGAKWLLSVILWEQLAPCTQPQHT